MYLVSTECLGFLDSKIGSYFLERKKALAAGPTTSLYGCGPFLMYKNLCIVRLPLSMKINGLTVSFVDI